MTVLDAQAIVAFVLGEPGADEVEAILRGASPRISAASVAEVSDVLARTYGKAEDEIGNQIDLLIAAGLEIMRVDEGIARVAGRIRAARYHRRRRQLSLGDCLALATAAWVGDPLATADEPLARTAHDERREVILLLDSTGRRATLD